MLDLKPIHPPLTALTALRTGHDLGREPSLTYDIYPYSTSTYVLYSTCIGFVQIRKTAAKDALKQVLTCEIIEEIQT